MPGKRSGTHGGVSLVESSTTSWPEKVWSGYSWPCVGGGWGQAHCWVLRDQPHVLPSGGSASSGVGVVGLLFLPLLEAAGVVEGVGGVVV